MISPEEALESLTRLRAAIKKKGVILRDAKRKARLYKLEHAKAIVNMENANTDRKIPATVRKEHALTYPAVQAAWEAADEADADLIILNDECEWDRERIMLFKALIKEGL